MLFIYWLIINNMCYLIRQLILSLLIAYEMKSGMMVVTSHFPEHSAIFKPITSHHKLITSQSQTDHKSITSPPHIANNHKAISSWLVKEHVLSMWYLGCSCKYTVWVASQWWSQTHHKLITTQSQNSQTFVITNFNPSPVWNPFTFEPPLYIITSLLYSVH